MKPTTYMTRFIGTPRVAAVLYFACSLTVLGWFGGEQSHVSAKGLAGA